MFKQTARSYGRFFATAALAFVAAAGCEAQGVIEGAVYPTAQATANSQKAVGIGTVQEVTGTYGEGCEGRQGAWSLAVNATTPLAHAALSVAKDNAACVLKVDGIRIAADAGSPILYVPKAPIPLLGGYASTPVGFGLSADAAAAFYVNASLLPDITFHGDFVVQVVYAEDPATTNQSRPAQPAATVGAAVSLQGVASPDYVASLLNLKVATSLLGIVTSVTGAIDLDALSQPGDSYCVLPNDLGLNPSYAAVDTAFRASVATPCNGAHDSIGWNRLSLLGISLQATVAVRTIIIAREVNGVRAYQTLTVKVAL